MDDKAAPGAPDEPLFYIGKQQQTLSNLPPQHLTRAMVQAWVVTRAKYDECLATFWVPGREDDKGKIRRADAGAAPPDSKQEDKQS